MGVESMHDERELAFDIDVDLFEPSHRRGHWEHLERPLARALCIGLVAVVGALPFLRQDPQTASKASTASTAPTAPTAQTAPTATTAPTARFAPTLSVADVAPPKAAVPVPLPTETRALDDVVDHALLRAEQPVAIVKPSTTHPKSEHARRLEVRKLADASAFFRVLDRTGATAPFEAKKQAAVVRAPKGEVIDAVLDKAGIDRVMRERGPAFQVCYERALKLDDTLRPTFDITFSIGATGSVRTATVVAKERDPRTAKLASCVKKVMERALFPPTEDAPLSVSRTLTFHLDALSDAHS